jgi:tetratricopeptide (TPR) repeat protein
MKQAAVCFIAFIALVLKGNCWAEGMGAERGTEQKQEREWFDKGQQAMAFGKHDEAIACFQKVLSINRDFTDAHRFLGDAYLKKGLPDSAIESYKKALDSKAQTVPALVGLGNGHLQKRMYAEAQSAYERALAVQPDNASARIGLGNIYYEKGDTGKALSEYQKGLAVEPDHAEAQLTVGLILQEKGETDKAAIHFYKAGLLFIKQGDRNGALEAYGHLQETKDDRLKQLLHDALQPSTKQREQH